MVELAYQLLETDHEVKGFYFYPRITQGRMEFLALGNLRHLFLSKELSSFQEAFF